MSKKSDVIFHKKIKLREQNQKNAQAISEKHELSPVLSRILAARGHKPGKELELFLKPTLKDGLLDPADLKNIEQAADLIAEHVQAGNNIAICADFDVDGTTGAAIIKNFFNQLGVESEVYIPDRFSEGYGLNQRMIDSASKNQQDLLIAIDIGTSNHKELELAKDKGIKTIVIDHHHVALDQFPPCDCLINPEQSGCGFADGTLCSAGLCWFLLIVLKKKIKAAEKIDLRDFLDLAALGTICDMVPLKGVNRTIALKGLEVLTNSKRTGIQALKDVIGITGKVNSYHVGFGFGPRINAAGRMMNGEIVVDLLTTDDPNNAQKIANRLNALNTERQEVEVKIKDQTIEAINQTGKLPYGIVAWGETYHTGVIGIVAQRLSETFYRPSIVMGMDSGKLKGSVRGIPGFSVVEALENLSDYFAKFGGHEGAGGFTLKENNPEDFQSAFNETCQKLLENVDLVPKATADAELSIEELDEDICLELKSLGPFGVGNSAPQILINKLKVRDLKLLKASHLKATVTDGKRYHSALFWNTTHHPALFQGSEINVVCKPDINTFGGETSVQLILQAVETA